MSTRTISPWVASMTRLDEAEAVVEAYRTTRNRASVDLDALRLAGGAEDQTRPLERRLWAAEIQLGEAVAIKDRALAEFREASHAR